MTETLVRIINLGEIAIESKIGNAIFAAAPIVRLSPKFCPA